METFSALLALCVGNSSVPGEFSTQRTVTLSFKVFFDVSPTKRLSNQSWGWWFETPSHSLWRHMKWNASKFQAMIMKLSPSTDPIMVDINGCNAQTSDCVKLLCIHIDDKLRFQRHISVICSRASRQINAMNRVSKFLSKESKLYNAFKLSNFLYCSIVWHFCSSHCSYKMGKKRALRVVLNDYQASYQD